MVTAAHTKALEAIFKQAMGRQKDAPLNAIESLLAEGYADMALNALREPVAEAPLAVPLPEGEKISQGDAEEMLKDAYAEGRAAQRESDATNILLLLGLCDEAVAVGDGRINTTDVYSLVGYFREEAGRNIHQPSEKL